MTDHTIRTRRFVRALKTRAWLWVLPTLIGFGGAAISVVPSQVPAVMVPTSATTQRLEDRIPTIRNEIFSRTRLERIIEALSLYPVERRTGFMEDVIEHMRSNIEMRQVGTDAIAIGFTTTNPRLAQRVADRLAAWFIDEFTRDRRLQVENTENFLESSLRDMKVRLVQAEENLAQAQARRGPRGSLAAETIELEFMKESYKRLLTQRHDSNIVANVEHREIGKQFRLVDAARVPSVPVGPARSLVKLIATLSGLAVGLILVALSAARPERPLAAQPEST
jgi:hypothetical protein